MPLVGAQSPRLLVAPESVDSSGDEAIDLAARVGLTLDPWQQFALRTGLGERADGQWSAFETALVVSRQNGKGTIFEALALAKLFLFGDELFIYSAHEFKTAKEAFRRLGILLDGSAELSARVLRPVKNPSEFGYDLRTGQRIRFFARTGGSGRGWTADTLFLDEAYNLGGEAMAALLPTLSVRPNPQVWYASSAAKAASDQLHALRARATSGGDTGRLAYMEWSAPEDADIRDPAAWALANPALGIRLSAEFVAAEVDAMPEAEFRRERLSIPDMATGETAVPLLAWMACADVESVTAGPVAFAVDVSPDRSSASISVAGMRSDGKPHVEVVATGAGTDWIVPRLVELDAAHHAPIALDPAGPAGSLIQDLQTARIEPVLAKTRDLTQACGRFYDLVVAGELRHRDEGVLNAAVAGARKRSVGDAWAWARKDARSDITPLYAATLALWAHAAGGAPADPGIYII